MVMLERVLNAAQREAFNYFSGAVSRGLGVNAAIRSYQDIGGAIRRSSALDLYRIITGQEKAADYFKSLTRNAIPDVRNIPIVRWSIKGNYYYNMRLDCFNTVTGDTFTKNVTVSSDSLMNRGQMEEEALKSLDPAAYDNQIGVSAIMPTKIGRRSPTALAEPEEDEIGRFGYD
jgi:hypothetical protein